MESIAIAVISPVIAVVSFVIGAFLENRRERRQRVVTIVSEAMSYFEGGSQKRSVGIAMLETVMKARDAHDFRPAIHQLYFAQLEYLLTGGRNRWEAHEVANIQAMADVLIGPSAWPPAGKEQQLTRLFDAMTQYVNDYALGKEGGNADAGSVQDLKAQIEAWQASAKPVGGPATR